MTEQVRKSWVNDNLTAAGIEDEHVLDRFD